LTVTATDEASAAAGSLTIDRSPFHLTDDAIVSSQRDALQMRQQDQEERDRQTVQLAFEQQVATWKRQSATRIGLSKTLHETFEWLDGARRSKQDMQTRLRALLSMLYASGPVVEEL
jgi:molecular chaperone DnaK (HSP70)